MLCSECGTPAGMSTMSPGPASTVVSLARPEQTCGATMLEGDATELAKQVAALLREQGALVD